ncbi:MAG: hypothetical protein HDR88_16565 [Bacteroides sp.]|nr:hypothetical protein [Bacteroides sp.]
MKYLSFTLSTILFPLISVAQTQDRQSVTPDEKSLFEEVTNIKKKTDKFNLYLNMHADFDTEFIDTHFKEGKFQMRQLRLEMKGQINDWLSYRYRQRLNAGDNPKGYRDNILKSIDYCMVGVRVDKVTFYLGKQCAAYGGIEFDLNPIEIYQYSDMIGSANNFNTGVNVSYNITPKQQLQFQVLNSYTGSVEDEYGNYQRAKLPLLYTINWNANFNNTYKPRWSASVMNQTKGEHLYYFAAGNEFNFTDKFGAYVDWMYSIEGVDRRGIISDIVAKDADRRASKVDYMSFVVHLNYRFHPSWNIFTKGMIENEGVYKTHDNIRKGNYRTAWGYVAGVEYYPFKDRSLHFFAAYVGRDYKYTALAKAYGCQDYNTSRVAVGFIWQMPVF